MRLCVTASMSWSENPGPESATPTHDRRPPPGAIDLDRVPATGVADGVLDEGVETGAQPLLRAVDLPPRVDAATLGRPPVDQRRAVSLAPGVEVDGR